MYGICLMLCWLRHTNDSRTNVHTLPQMQEALPNTPDVSPSTFIHGYLVLSCRWSSHSTAAPTLLCNEQHKHTHCITPDTSMHQNKQMYMTNISSMIHTAKGWTHTRYPPYPLQYTNTSVLTQITLNHQCWFYTSPRGDSKGHWMHILTDHT